MSTAVSGMENKTMDQTPSELSRMENVQKYSEENVIHHVEVSMDEKTLMNYDIEDIIQDGDLTKLQEVYPQRIIFMKEKKTKEEEGDYPVGNYPYLLFAASCGQLGIVKYLLDVGEWANQHDWHPWNIIYPETALWDCSRKLTLCDKDKNERKVREKIVMALIEAGGDLNRPTDFNGILTTPFFHIVQCFSTKKNDKLVKKWKVEVEIIADRYDRLINPDSQWTAPWPEEFSVVPPIYAVVSKDCRRASEKLKFLIGKGAKLDAKFIYFRKETDIVGFAEMTNGRNSIARAIAKYASTKTSSKEDLH